MKPGQGSSGSDEKLTMATVDRWVTQLEPRVAYLGGTNQALVEWLMLPEAPDPAAVLAELLQRPEWHERAACAGLSVDLFVIGRGRQYDAVRPLCESWACARSALLSRSLIPI